MRRPRMPRRIKLPFGFVIEVRYRTKKQLAAMGFGQVAGAWLMDGKQPPTIYVARDDHVADQCETIAHELQHSLTDYRHWVDSTLRYPLQQESAETALELSEDEEE